MSEEPAPTETGSAEKPRKRRGPRGGTSVYRALAKIAKPELLANPELALAWEEEFLKTLRLTPIPAEAAKITGISVGVVFRWRRESERFEALYQRAKEEGVEIMLEPVALQRAAEKSDLLMLGALNAYMPSRYKRDNARTAKFAGNGIVLEISDAS